MSNHLELPKGALKGTFNSYLAGFLLSIALTLAAYFSSVGHLLTRNILIPIIVGFALIQMIVQLIFFFHLAKETKPRWNLFIFLMMLFIIGIIVGGSLWIMYNLDDRMMPPMHGMAH